MPKISGSISISRRAIKRAMRAQTRLAGAVTRRLAEKQKELLLNRLARGQGLDDGRMPAYSPGHAARRKAVGRSTQTRDLDLTGQMVNSVEVKQADATTHQLGFSSRTEEEKARHNQAFAPFFGISTNDGQALQAEIKKIEKELKG